MALPAALLLSLLVCKWVEEYRNRRFHIGWDILEATAFLAIATAAGNPLLILILMYARLALGASTNTNRRAALLTLLYALSFAGGVAFAAPNFGISALTLPYFFLMSGFAIVPPVVKMLSESLAGLAQLAERDRSLRGVMTELGAATTATAVRAAAEPALRRLVGSPEARLRYITWRDADSLKPSQRECLHGAGLDLSGEDVKLLWPAAEEAPDWLLAVAMSSTGIVLVGCGPLREPDRMAVVTFVEHLAMRLEAVTLRDIAERRRIQALVQEREENFEHIFERNPQPMWIYDAESFRILAVNNAAVTAYGYTRDEFLAMAADALDVENATGAKHQLQDGRVIDVEVETSAVSFHGRSAVLLVARDVTEQRVLQRRLEHNAMHDPLTGLPNAVLLRNRVRRVAHRPALAAGAPALIVFDLDGFKAINDTLGHPIGDRVIAITGARLVQRTDDGDTAARLGGDEFAVLLNDCSRRERAQEVARELIAVISEPMVVNGESITVNASCGIAFPRPDHRSPEDLLGDADIAMYVAKVQGPGSCVVFEQSFRTALTDRLHLRRELTEAVQAERLQLEYQPQVDLRSGRVVAVEALARWSHPQRGDVPPDVFIPIAEQTGLVTAIDMWVIKTACNALRQWLDGGLPPMRMAVNISGRDLEHDDLVDFVRNTLVACRLDPWLLELEITETAAMAQPEAIVTRLDGLRAMGVRIAIDDFGTGFSMFSRLRDLPVDRLKVDRSFVTDLARDDDARTIVGSTIAMAHSLGLDLVAEGVEDAYTAQILTELDCDGAQGFHFARPLEASALLAWIASRAAADAERKTA